MITVGYDKELMERAEETKRLIQQRNNEMKNAVAKPLRFRLVVSDEDMFSESCVLKQLEKIEN